MSLRDLVLKRLWTSLIAVVGVTLLVFFFVHLVPGDPVENMLGEHATEGDRTALRKCMGLDLSIGQQFGRFVKSIGDGSLGRICPSQKVTVASEIRRAFPHTLRLAALSMLMALSMALPLGIAAALRRGSAFDAASMGFSLLGISVPYMVLGPVLLMVFYIRLEWFPGPVDAPSMHGLILPAFALATHLMAILSRMTRASMLDVMGEDYMRTARAKGLPGSAVVLKHGLRNALVPVITVAGIQFGSLLSGAIVVEKIFARPGMGTLLLDAISNRNYPMIQGCVLVIAVTYVTVNLLVDVAYGIADPRIRVR